MITLTEAAVDAACLALNDGVRSTLYRDRWESLVRHALEAALPHLTDDGATNTPPAVPSGVGAPQAPGATGEAAERASGAGNTVAAPSSPHPSVRVGYDAVFAVIREKQQSERPSSIQVNALIWRAVHAFREAMGIDGSVSLVAEGATPAIDREALGKVFNVCDAYERQGMGSASDFDKGAQRAAVDIHNALLNALGGAS